MPNLTYTQGRNFFGQLSNNSSTANLTFGDILIGQFTLELVHKYNFIFGEQTFSTLETYPSQQFYTLNIPLRKINTVVINVGNTGGTSTTGTGFNWPVMECPTMEYWNQLNLTNNITSDIPQYYIYYNGQLGIYPKPATGYNPITIRGEIDVTNTSVADVTETKTLTIPYALTLTGSLASGATSATLTASWTLTTGTYQMIFSSGDNKLVTLTNGSAAVTWSSELTATATTAVTVRSSGGGDILTGASNTAYTGKSGYVFQITQPTGDGYYYTVDTVYNANQFSIKGAYQGATISAVSVSNTIGQSSVLPSVGQMIPIYRALEVYYTTVSKDKERAETYKGLADLAESTLRIDQGNKDTDPTVQDDFGRQIINPNLTINTTGSSTNQ